MAAIPPCAVQSEPLAGPGLGVSSHWSQCLPFSFPQLLTYPGGVKGKEAHLGADQVT